MVGPTGTTKESGKGEYDQLMWANTLHFFKEAGVDFDKRDNKGYTALLHMCENDMSLTLGKLQFQRYRCKL